MSDEFTVGDYYVAALESEIIDLENQLSKLKKGRSPMTDATAELVDTTVTTMRVGIALELIIATELSTDERDSTMGWLEEFARRIDGVHLETRDRLQRALQSLLDSSVSRFPAVPLLIHNLTEVADRVARSEDPKEHAAHVITTGGTSNFLCAVLINALDCSTEETKAWALVKVEEIADRTQNVEVEKHLREVLQFYLRPHEGPVD